MTKFINKGLVRHTIVQAIIWDYFDISELTDKKEIANLCAENVPALLASIHGLKTACGIFAISDKKE